MTAWFLSLILFICLIATNYLWRKKYHLLSSLDKKKDESKRPSRLVKDLGMADMFANMPDGILVTNSKRKIDFANPAFCKMFELNEDPSYICIARKIEMLFSLFMYRNCNTSTSWNSNYPAP